MKITFTDFIQANPIYKKFATNNEAQEIFEEILSREENIIAMIEASENGKSALSACVLEVEAFYNVSVTKSFDLCDNFTKQCLGTMVKSIIEPFGYRVIGQKNMPRVLHIKYVTSASTYKLIDTPRMKIIKTIIEC